MITFWIIFSLLNPGSFSYKYNNNNMLTYSYNYQTARCKHLKIYAEWNMKKFENRCTERRGGCKLHLSLTSKASLIFLYKLSSSLQTHLSGSTSIFHMTALPRERIFFLWRHTAVCYIDIKLHNYYYSCYEYFFGGT